MEHFVSLKEFQSACDSFRARGNVLGLVPTMGALHEGHLRLINQAQAECDVVAVSIFVNRLQFDDPYDFASYPRTMGADLDLAREAGVDIVFSPFDEEMHPTPILTHLEVDKLGEVLEGTSRPGHFSGVATVVAKLFMLAGRCRAYFGEKDFQQLAIVRRMVEEMHFPIEVVAVPIVREPSGLAISSRNRRLDANQKVAAQAIPRALFAGMTKILAGVDDPDEVEQTMKDELEKDVEGVSHVDLPVLDYALVVDPATLSRPEQVRGEVKLLIAATVGDVRLIDNMSASVNK